MRVLVTGCTGYLGHQIAVRLARSGLTVTGSSRRPFSLEGVEIITGDHSSTDFVNELVTGSDVIIHFAGRTRGHNAKVFHRDNESLTSLLCTRASEHNKGFIYISSDQAVYQTGSYGRSKRACEGIVARESSNYVVLRLTAVVGCYAPHMESTFSRTIKRLHDASFVLVPGDCDFEIAPVAIGDVEFSLRKLLEFEKLPNDTFEVCGRSLTLKALIDLFEQRLGVHRTRIPLPIAPLRSVARLLKPYKTFSKLPLDALLDLGKPVRVSYQKLGRLIGFVPTEMNEAVLEIEDFPA